jgi:hypothetical protein
LVAKCEIIRISRQIKIQKTQIMSSSVLPRELRACPSLSMRLPGEMPPLFDYAGADGLVLVGDRPGHARVPR